MARNIFFENYTQYLEFKKTDKTGANGFEKKYKNSDVSLNYIPEESTNTNCWNCLNCNYCENCVECKDCSYCRKCQYCEECVGEEVTVDEVTTQLYCVNCKNCKNCKNTTNCESCTSCNDCEKCINCDTCTSCKNCLNCNIEGEDEYDSGYENESSENSQSCSGIKNCKSCINCKHCDDCKNCSVCVSCNECDTCVKCNGCSICYDCNECNDLEETQGRLKSIWYKKNYVDEMVVNGGGNSTGGDPHKPKFKADYSTNYSNFSNFTGSGTETDPYQIWDEEMWKNMQFKVRNNGLTDITWFKQMRDIVWEYDGNGVMCFNVSRNKYNTYYYGNSENLYGRFCYDGGGYNFTVNNNNVVFNSEFISKITNGYSVTQQNFYSRDGNIGVLCGNHIKNITVKFSGEFKSDSDYVGLDFSVVKGNIIDNVIIENLNYNAYGSPNVIRSIGTGENGLVNNCHIRNCNIKCYNGLYGHTISTTNSSKCSNSSVKNCKIIDSSACIYTGYCVNCEVENIHYVVDSDWNNETMEYSGCYYGINITNCLVKNITVDGNNFCAFYVNNGTGNITPIIKHCEVSGYNTLNLNNKPQSEANTYKAWLIKAGITNNYGVDFWYSIIITGYVYILNPNNYDVSDNSEWYGKTNDSNKCKEDYTEYFGEKTGVWFGEN